MANQIADNVGGQGRQTASAVADHIKRFWDPAMRRDLSQAVDRSVVSVSPEVVAALEELSASSR